VGPTEGTRDCLGGCRECDAGRVRDRREIEIAASKTGRAGKKPSTIDKRQSRNPIQKPRRVNRL